MFKEEEMVYKFGNVDDMALLPSMDERVIDTIYAYVSVLTNEYGQDRNVDQDDGGYVLFATKGTSCEEIKAYFDYTQKLLEYVNRSGELCAALYSVHNEYWVTVICFIADAPNEFVEAFEEGY
jgi:hypothetical protein